MGWVNKTFNVKNHSNVGRIDYVKATVPFFDGEWAGGLDGLTVSGADSGRPWFIRPFGAVYKSKNYKYGELYAPVTLEAGETKVLSLQLGDGIEVSATPIGTVPTNPELPNPSSLNFYTNFNLTTYNTVQDTSALVPVGENYELLDNSPFDVSSSVLSSLGILDFFSFSVQRPPFAKFKEFTSPSQYFKIGPRRVYSSWDRTNGGELLAVNLEASCFSIIENNRVRQVYKAYKRLSENNSIDDFVVEVFLYYYKDLPYVLFSVKFIASYYGETPYKYYYNSTYTAGPECVYPIQKFQINRASTSYDWEIFNHKMGGIRRSGNSYVGDFVDNVGANHEGQWMAEGQSFNFQGAIYLNNSDTARSVSQHRLRAICNEWADYNNYGIFGFIPSSVWTQAVMDEYANSTYQSFANDNVNLKSLWWVSPPGSDAKAGRAGDQEDFALIHCLDVVLTKDSRLLERMVGYVLNKEAKRPTHLRESDGRRLTYDEHPRLVFWDSKIHYYNHNMDKCGKYEHMTATSPAWPLAREDWNDQVNEKTANNQLDYEKIQTPDADSSQAHYYTGHNDEHWSRNSLTFTTLLSPDYELMEEIYQDITAWKAFYNLQMLTDRGGIIGFGPTEARATGRMGVTITNDFLLTGDSQLLVFLTKYMEMVYDSWYFGGDFPRKPMTRKSANVWSSVFNSNCWGAYPINNTDWGLTMPWQNGVGIAGLMANYLALSSCDCGNAFYTDSYASSQGVNFSATVMAKDFNMAAMVASTVMCFGFDVDPHVSALFDTSTSLWVKGCAHGQAWDLSNPGRLLTLEERGKGVWVEGKWLGCFFNGGDNNMAFWASPAAFLAYKYLFSGTPELEVGTGNSRMIYTEPYGLTAKPYYVAKKLCQWFISYCQTQAQTTPFWRHFRFMLTNSAP